MYSNDYCVSQLCIKYNIIRRYAFTIPVDEGEEVDFLVSGWGDQEVDLRDDLLKQWGDMLEKWDGRERWDPSGDKPRNKQLVKLVRKVCFQCVSTCLSV